MSNNIRDVVIMFFMTIPSVLCVVAAGFLAYEGVGGWGWFLFIALIVTVSKYKSDKDDEKQND